MEKAHLTVFGVLAAAVLLPVTAIAVLICVLGRREADYNAQVAKALFAGEEWPASLGPATDEYYARMRVSLEDLRAAWLSLHADDGDWDEGDHEAEGLLMRVCFFVAFYKSSRNFEKDDYKAFARIFDDAKTVNAAFAALGLFCGDFGDKEQKAVRDCVFLLATDEVPPPEADVSPDFGKWEPQADYLWHDLPLNLDGTDVVAATRERRGDPYSVQKAGMGQFVDWGTSPRGAGARRASFCLRQRRNRPGC